MSEVSYLAGANALQYIVSVTDDDLLGDVVTLDEEFMDHGEFSREMLSHIAFHGVDCITVRTEIVEAHDVTEYCACGECDDDVVNVEVTVKCCHDEVRTYTYAVTA